ncbi:DddA-like double-stranded DNA deaminase toxin [Solwaraspora sp. WMMA2065]|uniref:DddA-like double-stranded DNA deaminase toxin n=1 Tax=Solwaraspora sp. WMMA2065 TaxID=3015166 RepID=UPI00338F7988
MIHIGIPLGVSSGSPEASSLAGEPSSPSAAVLAAASEVRAVLPRGSKTAGVLLSSDGQDHGGLIWSGDDGPGRGAPGLRRDSPLRWHQMAAATQHVEGHVAAMLRRPGAPTEATLVVSVQPCGGPKGCNRRLAEMLPVGTTLRVYVAGADNRTTWWADYRGNGRGVA